MIYIIYEPLKWQRRIQNPVEHLRWSVLRRFLTGLRMRLSSFTKSLHRNFEGTVPYFVFAVHILLCFIFVQLVLPCKQCGRY